MKTYLLNIWDAARSSYWFVPTLFATVAVCLSFVVPAVDAWIAESGFVLQESIRTTTETARSTLSAMAGAMIAVTGTVFSITIVTLSLASQQFGPRLLRRFMYDLTTQLTLGVFLSTSCYCLLVLRVIEKHDDAAFVPHLSVFVAVALSVLSMAFLIMFIHHIAIMIQAPHVVASVASDLNSAVDRLFPETIGEPTEDESDTISQREKAQLANSAFSIRSTQAGYIQAIDGDGIMAIAEQHDVAIRLTSRPGDFIAIESKIADVCLTNGKDIDEDKLASQLNQSIIVGIRRTPRQDVECAVDELVEVAVRALSPGINDPFTAINCIDHLSAALCRFANRKLPTAYRFDDDDHLRLVAQHVTFSDVLDAAFNQIRQYGRDSVAVTIRLLEAMHTIAEHVNRDDDRRGVLIHAQMIGNSANSFPEDADAKAVQFQRERVKVALEASRCKGDVSTIASTGNV